MTRTEVAEEAGVSAKTVDRVRMVLDSGDTQLIEQAHTPHAVHTPSTRRRHAIYTRTATR